MRLIDRNNGPSVYKPNSRVCCDSKCLKTTREGKPYCPEHVEQNPHANQVIGVIARRKEEDDAVRLGDTPVDGYNVSGLTAQAIIQELAMSGTRTRERVCRELNLDRVVLDGYAKALIRKGIIREGMTGRGNATLYLA